MAPWLEMIVTSLTCSVSLQSSNVQTFISVALCPQLPLSHKLATGYFMLFLGWEHQFISHLFYLIIQHKHILSSPYFKG